MIKLQFNSYFFLTIILLTACGPSGEELAIQEAKKRSRDSLEKVEKEKSIALEKLREDSLNYFILLSDSLYSKRRTNEAIEYLDSALTYAEYSDESEIYRKLADYNFEKRKYDDAITFYTKIIERGIELDTHYYQRAVCHKKLNDKESAIGDLKESMALGHEEADKLYNRLNPERKRVVGYVTRCCDGSTSNATGRGACSHHGGVCNWNEPVYETYREY